MAHDLSIGKLLRSKAALLIAAAPLFIVFIKLTANMQGDLDIGIQLYAVMLALFLLGAGLLLSGQWKTLNKMQMTALLALVAIALLIRMSMLSFRSGDYRVFIAGWVAAMERTPGAASLGMEIANYNMPYVYLLFLIAKLRPFHNLFYVKFVSIAFDLLLAYAVRQLVLTGNASEKRGNVAFLAVLFAPTFVLNSALWGQCDSIYAACVALGLLFGLRGNSKRCFLLFGLGFAFKLQTVFLMPMLLAFLILNRIRLRDVWIFFGINLLLLLPAVLAGRAPGDMLSVYTEQMSLYPTLNLHSTSVYSLFGNMDFRVKWYGIGIACALCILILYACWRYRDRWHTQLLVECAFLASLGIPLFLPYMHERYFYCAEALSIVYWGIYPNRWKAPVVVLLCGLLAYCTYLTGEAVIPLPYATLAMLYVFGALARDLYMRICGQADTEIASV